MCRYFIVFIYLSIVFLTNTLRHFNHHCTLRQNLILPSVLTPESRLQTPWLFCFGYQFAHAINLKILHEHLKAFCRIRGMFTNTLDNL